MAAPPAPVLEFRISVLGLFALGAVPVGALQILLVEIELRRIDAFLGQLLYTGTDPEQILFGSGQVVVLQLLAGLA